MTLKNVIIAFLSSRGGLIVLSAVVAVIARIVLWPFTTRDWVIAGLIVALWPRFEYAVHRWLLHEWTWTPFRKTHDRHHDEPTTETGLPDMWVIRVYFLLSIAFAFLWPGLYTAHATVQVMLLIYEFIHFTCHCNYEPKTWWGCAVRVNHLQHHKLQSADRYAMSLPILRVKGKKQQ